MATTATIIHTTKYAKAHDGATAVQMIPAIALAPRFPKPWIPASKPKGSLDEALHESESRVRDLAPAAVDDKPVPAVGHLDDLSHRLIALLPLV